MNHSLKPRSFVTLTTSTMNKFKLQFNILKLTAVLLVGILIIIFRYGYLQLVEGHKLAERMKYQVGVDYLVQSPRGNITDRNGRELAASTMTKSLFVDPSNVTNPIELAHQLSPLIDKPVEDIINDINIGGGFVWIKRRLEHFEYESVRKLIRDHNYINCLGFRDEAKRYYPNDFLAANVLGFVGTDDNGFFGIEQAFDSYIKGEVTESFLYTDSRSRPILDSIFDRTGYNGDRCKSIQLTIDAAIQFIVEQELDRAMAENDPVAVTCVAMNPATGEILAMASRPTFNPNRFWDYPAELWQNRAVSFIYEPGSTFKTITAGAALQENIVTPNEIFDDPGYVIVSGMRIQNWNGASFGTVTFADVVKQSLNTGFALIGLELGADNLVHYAKLFGFGEYTGVELPGEECGLIYQPDSMVDSDIATMAIGQSIAVTPLQLVTAMSAVANNGTLLKPHIVKSIKNANGSTYSDTAVEPVRQTIDPAVDKTLVGLLEQVVSTGGGQKAKVRGYRVAGKTGTAQKVIDGRYIDGRYIASFLGFGPVENPQIALLVMIDDPKGVFYGGQIAAPVASRIFSQVFRYLKIEPSVEDDFDDIPDEVGEGDSGGFLEESGYKKQDSVDNFYTSDLVNVPNFYHKSIRESVRLANSSGLILETSGSGYAISQSIPAGETVKRGSIIKISFSPG